MHLQPRLAHPKSNLGETPLTEPSKQDIACHKSATPGSVQIPVTAGSTIQLQWNTWPDSHHGPVINYLAKCSGSCTTVDKSTLSWGKIQQGGLIDDTSPPGKWASDQLLGKHNREVAVLVAIY
jgi:cellulase